MDSLARTVVALVLGSVAVGVLAALGVARLAGLSGWALVGAAVVGASVGWLIVQAL